MSASLDVAPRLVMDHCRKLDDPYVQQLVRMVEERENLLTNIARRDLYPTAHTKAAAAYNRPRLDD